MTTKKRLTLKDLKEIIGEELTFGNSLRAERESREMSRKAFGELLGISVQSLYDLEHGRKIPSPERAAKIATLLEFNIAPWVQLALKDELRSKNLKLDISVTNQEIA